MNGGLKEGRFATSSFLTNGRTYHHCQICRAWYTTDGGIKIEYSNDNCSGFAKYGLCRKCANKLVPVIINAIDQIEDMRNVIPKRDNMPEITKAYDEFDTKILGFDLFREVNK